LKGGFFKWLWKVHESQTKHDKSVGSRHVFWSWLPLRKTRLVAEMWDSTDTYDYSKRWIC